MGGGGTVILILLAIAVAVLAAVQCRSKRKLSLESNQAYGVHNHTMKATEEDKHYDSIDTTVTLVPPSNNISKQTEDALYEDMQADAANTEPTTGDNVDMASAVFTGHVTVSPNQAYGVTSIKKNDDNEYEDTGPIYDEANEVETNASPNQAYGVTGVKKNNDKEYEDTGLINEAGTDHMMMSAYEIIKA